MNNAVSVDRQDYQAWRAQFGARELDFTRILDGIWKLLCGDISWLEEREGFYLLIVFAERVRQNQDQMIQELCAQNRRNRWEIDSARAADLYLRLKPQAEILREKLETLDQKGFYRYFYRVLEYNLIFCNTQAIAELIGFRGDGGNGERLENDDGLPDEGLYEGLRRPSRYFRTLHELIQDLQVRQRAAQLHHWLKEEWQLKDLNALCHYYEVLNGIQTERLARESNANIDQIHFRLRKKFREFLGDKGFDTQDARAFFACQMPDLCQETPVASTYKNREG